MGPIGSFSIRGQADPQAPFAQSIDVLHVINV